MALSSSIELERELQPVAYGTFFGHDNGSRLQVELPVLQTGVDFTKLRKFIPVSKSDSEISFLSRDNTRVDLVVPARTSIRNGGENRNLSSDAPAVWQSADTDKFLAECELQFSRLFGFINRSIKTIERRLGVTVCWYQMTTTLVCLSHWLFIVQQRKS